MRTLFLCTTLGLVFGLSGLAHAEEAEMDPLPEITEQYTMLYYSDMDAPRRFYGELLGLTSTMDDEWLSLYQVTAGSFLGIIKEGDDSWHNVQETNAVMVSIVTNDVNTWYERIVSDGGVKILQEIYDNEAVPIRAFLVEDPGGYTVEFFQWTK